MILNSMGLKHYHFHIPGLKVILAPVIRVTLLGYSGTLSCLRFMARIQERQI